MTPGGPRGLAPTCAARRRSLLAALLAGAAMPWTRARAAEAAASAASGPGAARTEAVRVLDLDWADTARQRPLPVRLYLPGDAAARREPLPLVVFSHGIGGSRAGYRYLGEHWARHGIAALHLQHVGSDRDVWSGNPFEVFERLRGAATDDEALARVQDLRFALDVALAGDAPVRVDGAAVRFDARRVVAAGHSYGANTAMLASGARVLRGGAPVSLRDARVAAAVLISAPPFYGQAEAGGSAGVVAGLAVPSLHVTSTGDVIRIPGFFSEPADRIALFEAAGGNPKWLAVFNEGTHSAFVGRAGEGSRLLVATREVTLAFLQRVLGLPGGDFAGWKQRHAALVERFVGPLAA